MAIRIEDVATPRLFEERALRVIANDLLVVLVSHHLQHVEPDAQARHRQPGEDGEDEQASKMYGTNHGLRLSWTNCDGRAFVAGAIGGVSEIQTI